MKICPHCRTLYTDDTLRFCLQDGAVLIISSGVGQPTGSLEGSRAEPLSVGPDSQDTSEVTQWRRRSQADQIPINNKGHQHNSRLLMLLGIVLGVVALSAVAGGMGLWLYLRDNRSDGVHANDNVIQTINGNTKIGPSPTNISNPPRTPVATASPPVNSSIDRDRNESGGTQPVTTEPEQISARISSQIYSWRAALESRDLKSLMTKYAASVQYYRKAGANREFIRADKQRAFIIYESIALKISGINVTVDPTGDTATATFDKEWVFSGARRSAGKVRQELRFSKMQGEWLITGERDIKVYYTY